jgi:hypothetical protein
MPVRPALIADPGAAMQHILVYSNSLSWGIIPTTRQSLAFEHRWPGVMENAFPSIPPARRFTRIEADRLFEIEHFSGHHFILTIELQPAAGGTEVKWRQTFDTAEHYRPIAEFVAAANEQNLERLAAKVERGRPSA